MEEPKVTTIGDVIDSTVMHINKGNPLLRGNPKGTHTELKGNPVTGLISQHSILLRFQGPSDRAQFFYAHTLRMNFVTETIVNRGKW